MGNYRNSWNFAAFDTGIVFFVSRSTREKEEKEHPLQGTLGKVATAIEAMAPEEEAEEEELELPDEEEDAGDDE